LSRDFSSLVPFRCPSVESFKMSMPLPGVYDMGRAMENANPQPETLGWRPAEPERPRADAQRLCLLPRCLST